jgi:hypothetical protein
MDEEEQESALVTALLSGASVITAFWIESLLAVVAMHVAVTELILFPVIAVVMVVLAWKVVN